MNMRRHLTPLVTFSLIAMVALVASCGDKTTNPGGGPPAKELDSGNIANGGTYAHTFNTLGTFDYHCTIHGLGMSGQVVVSAGAPATAAVTISNNSYNSASLAVTQGSTVTWTNNGSTHTVTSH